MNEAQMTDSELKAVCFEALTSLVGHVGMERFIVMMNREPRDYTKWRESHFCEPNETIEELAEKIKSYRPRHVSKAPVLAP